MFTYDPGFTSTASCESDITFIDGDKGILLYRGYPIDELAETFDVPRSLLPAALRRTADQGADGGIQLHHHPPHDGARAAGVVLPRLPPRRASDGGDVRRGRRAVGLLSRLHRHQRSQAAPDRQPPPGRQDADHRGDGVQIFDRPALRLSAQQARLHREFPAHVLLGPGRGVRGQSGAGQGAGHHLHPARRPRAERLDLDGAPGRLVGRQSVRLHRGGHRLPVGPGAWRRQRGGAEDAGGDRHRRPHPGIYPPRQGQERSASA